MYANQHTILLFLGGSIRKNIYLHIFSILSCFRVRTVSHTYSCDNSFYVHIKAVSVGSVRANNDISIFLRFKLGNLQLGDKCNHERWYDDSLAVWVGVRSVHKKIKISIVIKQWVSKIFHKNITSNKLNNCHNYMAISQPAYGIPG